jgi:Trk-type K+ transport system membrane component
VRSGGFYVVAISGLYIGTQITYVIMMYISVYPVVITMRHTNVYEERSLGIYAEDSKGYNENPDSIDLEDNTYPMSTASTMATSRDPPGIGAPLRRRRSHQQKAAATIGRVLTRTFTMHGVGVGASQPVKKSADGTAETRIDFISQQVHGQLAHDIWWLVLAVMIISTIETSHFLGDPVSYSVFNVIFEVVSGYGTVGISVGLPNQAYSFSGGWQTASKLILCAVMLRGRHRGLPVALDRAVRLPSERLHRDEEEDFRIRRSMTSRRLSLDTGI